MIFNIPQGANMLYPERPIGYSVPRENYYVPGWQPEYVIFAQPIYQPSGAGYWDMKLDDYVEGNLDSYAY